MMGRNYIDPMACCHWLRPSLAALFCCAMLVACSKPTASQPGTSSSRSSGNGRPQATGAGGAANAKPRTVTVAPVELHDLERVVTVTGSFLAHEAATLSVKVPGRLRSIHVDLGSVVEAGEVIAQVDPTDYEIRVRQAEAAVAQARAGLGLPLEGTNDTVDVETMSAVREARAVLEEALTKRERQRNLSSAGLISASELDAVEATYKVALNRSQSAIEEAHIKMATLGQRRAELAFAQKQLADTAMRAPFDGAVQRREAGLGEYVAAGTPVISLVRSDPLRLRLEIPEREAAAVRQGQPVRLLVEGYTNRWIGRIDRLSPALNESNRMLVIESDIPNDGSLRPGLFVRAEVLVNAHDPSLSVPARAVIAFAGLEKVILIEDGKAVERTVTTGRNGPGWMEVVSGLKAGERVVIDPGGLRTGQPVTVAGEEPLKITRTSQSPH
jgi:RND family efflux transporter MFP subunit